tara:strand:+ start:128 stop:478 length:351 start_codon:yes stop_codon:yes gene_type:complete
MFPGDEASGLPSFAQLNISCSTSFCFQPYKDLNDALAIILIRTDVNQILKELKSDYFDLTQAFIQKALEVYFTHPKVISVMRDGEIVLYPHVRVLNDMDYHLLEPVVTKNLGATSV